MTEQVSHQERKNFGRFFYRLGLLTTAFSLGVVSQQLPASALELTSTRLSQDNAAQPSATGTKQNAPSEPTLPSQSNVRFSCQFQNGAYTVMYQPESQPGTAYPWATPQTMGGGWSAERRCSEISRRLEEYRPDGLLELRTSVENGYDIVCATTEQNSLCRIVFTVPEGQDPLVTRDRVFENLAVANSGQSTSAVNTFTGGDGSQLLDTIGQELGINLPSLPNLGGRSQRNRTDSINLRPFLDPADGGTGTQLR
ncbi:MAG: COP23 domain-containing protein [Cyanobacteria bacterium J06627_8]